MTKFVLADTDVLIDFLRGHPAAIAVVKANAGRIILSSIVVAELYAGVKGDQERQALDELVALFPLVPLTGDLARAAGLYKRDYAKSHGIGLADAVVAATVVSGNSELLTLNVKHYPMLKGLRPAYSKN